MALRLLNRAVVLPVLGFGLGAATFMKAWPDEAGTITLHKGKVATAQVSQRSDIIQNIADSPLYNQLRRDPNIQQSLQSDKIPVGHKPYHVGQGILFGKNKLEIDPLIFLNESEGKLTVFYHLGKDLGNEKGAVHKGIVSLLMDEALCYCGFPRMPSKRGVTAKLSLKFNRDIPVDSTVILTATVRESKGRKCIIDGNLQVFNGQHAFPGLWGEKEPHVQAECVLVEPKWFKYFKRLNMF